jgi:hypothetical protein
MVRRTVGAALVAALVSLGGGAVHAQAVNSEWNTGSGNWNVPTNWLPNDVPDNGGGLSYNVQIGNRPAAANATVTLLPEDGTSDTIETLALSAGADLWTNGNQLVVNGLATIAGAGSTIRVDAHAVPATASFQAAAAGITPGGVLQMNGGVASVTANVDVASGGMIAGSGVLNAAQVNVASGATVHVNGGTLDVNATLNLNAGSNIVVDAAAVADLATTIVNATANVTVDGTMTLGTASQLTGLIGGAGLFRLGSTSTVTANTTISTTSFDWDGLDAGNTQTINNGVVLTINSTTWDADDPTPDVDDNIHLGGNGAQIVVNSIAGWTMARTLNANTAGAGTATIGGASPLALAGPLAVLNVDGNTNITAPVTFGAGSVASIDVGRTLSLGVNAAYDGGTIGGAGTSLPASANAVTANSSISAANFDFDAGSWNISSNALLNVNVTDYDTDAATNAFNGVINLNDGDINILTGDAEFVMDGVLNMNATVNGNPVFWIGEAFDLGNDAGVLDADLNVTGTQQSQFGTEVDFNSDADVNVAAGATLSLLGTVNFNTVNGPNNAEFTGAGTISFSGPVNVNEAATLNMVGGTVDLDGLDAAGDVINIDAPLSINAQTMSAFGRSNGGGGVNTLDVNNSVGTGALTVNLDNASAEWTLNPEGVMNLVNDNTTATLLAGSAVNLNGTVNVTGDVQIDARVDIAGTINLNSAGVPLRLGGGNLGANFNTIAGGVINGPGVLSASSNRELRGFGTILANVDFDGDSDLLADGGLLAVSGSIVDANVVGTADSDGILQIGGVWNSIAVNTIHLNGGELRGGTITVGNANGIQGEGRVGSRVLNNTRITADSGVLVVQTTLNDNDWDGAGAGQLRAGAGATLEIRDVGAAFGFTGTVAAVNGGRVFANGFALDFNPGSTLSLTAATYESTRSTDLGGTVTIGAGPASTIKVENNSFLTFETGSTTTLNGNLQLLNNNIIVEQGAAFSGAGALIVPDGSHLVGEPLANIGVLLDMQGAFRPGNDNGIGRVNLFDYQQRDAGELYVEITGTALNAFDRLVATGDIVLDGYLNIDIDGPFVPALGNTFNIISGTSVAGTFDTVNVSGVPAGLAFRVTYLPNAVQLQVVNKPIFTADFDDDGDVDATDLTIWRGAYNLNQLGDADGDNDSDGNDFLIWQRQFGSKPAVAAGGATQAPVPEPAAVALALAACVCCLAARRTEQR